MAHLVFSKAGCGRGSQGWTFLSNTREHLTGASKNTGYLSEKLYLCILYSSDLLLAPDVKLPLTSFQMWV